MIYIIKIIYYSFCNLSISLSIIYIMKLSIYRNIIFINKIYILSYMKHEVMYLCIECRQYFYFFVEKKLYKLNMYIFLNNKNSFDHILIFSTTSTF